MSKIDDAFNILLEKKMITYGCVIPQKEIEETLSINLNISQDSDSFWEHQGKFLSLKELIEKKGFFTTQRGHRKDLYILPLTEMADYVEQQYRRIKRIQKKVSTSMKEADASLLDDNSKDKHYHQINKLTTLIQVTKSVLCKRKA